MTATIIPFPTPVPLPRSTALQPTPSPSGSGAIPPFNLPPRPGPVQPSPIVRPPTTPAARPASIPIRMIEAEAIEAGTTKAWPIGSLVQVPYAGPCRRTRAVRPAPASWPAASSPARPAQRAPTLAPPAQPDRLARALESLRAALAQQSGAVAEWRRSLAELQGATGSLHASLTLHRTTVQTLGERVSLLRAVSAKLPQSLNP